MEKITSPWLSVIIPTYNGARYLVDCLDSLVRQDIEGIEYIAIDDGSTDSTLMILESYRNRLPLKIVQNCRAGSWVTNTNEAVGLAKGTYISFLHQDDRWLDNRLIVMKELLRRYPDRDFYLSTAQYIDATGRFVGLLRCPFVQKEGLLPKTHIFSRLLVQNFIAIPAPVFRRDLFFQVGGMDPGLWYTADWDLWLKISEIAQGCYTPLPTVAFRIHPASQTIQRSTDITDFREQLDQVLRRHLGRLSFDHEGKKVIEKCGLFSNKVNASLAAASHGKWGNIAGLIFSFSMLGPEVWLMYCRCSRIFERVVARLRTKVTQDAV